MQRSPGSCPATAQRDSGGSPTVHPWTGVELGAIPCAHPAGYPYVTLPLHRGPGYCASCAAKTKQIPARLDCALEFPSPAQREKVPKADEGGFGFSLLLWRARCALSGSRHSRRACGGNVRRMAHRKWASSTPVHGWTVGEPRSRRAHLEHRDCAQGVSVGWPSLWLLSLGHARESDSLAGRRVKNRHGCRAPKERKEPNIAPKRGQATEVAPTRAWADARQGCRATKERKRSIAPKREQATEFAPTKMYAKKRQGSGAPTKRTERKSARRAGPM